ncbi:cyanide insensitive terminal subunit iii [Roseivivax halodurans JCM 10272]|uniref:Cyanide insensitive terminal subunit iii n=1 Tax=Roseivivax halodurans JCM 10272 TaxID=1449350 RepID=X7EK33_9RHOB|nr:DUF2474 family protein [Roseivivax halodurans]ETX16434.1 cyanide insensitive terminal subunit iii [Roseivivax halodurans JCM 10272]
MLKRMGWFALIWVLSVGALGLVAYGIRLMIL